MKPDELSTRIQMLQDKLYKLHEGVQTDGAMRVQKELLRQLRALNLQKEMMEQAESLAANKTDGVVLSIE